MRATRRGVMAGGFAGALAVPTLAGLAGWRWRHGEGSVLLYDPSLEAGRRFAAAGRAAGGRVVALDGDAIRLAHAQLEHGPALVAGVSRHADALLFEEAAAEAGYRQVAALDGRREGCAIVECRQGWDAIDRVAEDAGSAWIEALAAFAARPAAAMPSVTARPAASLVDPHLALAWVLARS